MITAEQFKAKWRQVPGEYVWQSKEGVVVSVRGSPNEGWYAATVTQPVRGDYGTTANQGTKLLSPYYLTQSKPVGEVGRTMNARVRATNLTQRGDMADAINAAFNYMKKSVRSK